MEMPTTATAWLEQAHPTNALSLVLIRFEYGNGWVTIPPSCPILVDVEEGIGYSNGHYFALLPQEYTLLA